MRPAYENHDLHNPMKIDNFVCTRFVWSVRAMAKGKFFGTAQQRAMVYGTSWHSWDNLGQLAHSGTLGTVGTNKKSVTFAVLQIII